MRGKRRRGRELSHNSSKHYCTCTWRLASGREGVRVFLARRCADFFRRASSSSVSGLTALRRGPLGFRSGRASKPCDGDRNAARTLSTWGAHYTAGFRARTRAKMWTTDRPLQPEAKRDSSKPPLPHSHARHWPSRKACTRPLSLGGNRSSSSLLMSVAEYLVEKWVSRN